MPDCLKIFSVIQGELSRRKWSPAAGGPAGPSKVAAVGPPLPQVVPLY